MTTWAVSRMFRLVSGEFNQEAHSHLTKRSIRRIPNQPGHYVFTTKIEAETNAAASFACNSKLIELLAPYGVEAWVYAGQEVEVTDE